MSAADDLGETLADLFIAASQVVACRLRSIGHESPFTMLVERPVAMRRGPGSWCVDYRKAAENILADDVIAGQVAPWLTHAEIASARDCGAKIAESARMTLPFAGMFIAVYQLIDYVADADDLADCGIDTWDYDNDPGAWVAGSVVLPALQRHLQALPSIDQAGPAAARLFADEVLKVTRDSRLRYRVTAQLSGIDIDAADSSELSVGDISVRRLSDTEQGQWIEENADPPGSGTTRTGPPQVALEISVPGPRVARLRPGGGVAFQLTTAFQLHGYPVAGRGATERSDPDWVLPGVMPVPLTLPGSVTTSSVLTASSFCEVVATAKLLGRYNISQPRSIEDLALRRFVAGAARQDPSDAVLDFTIALEALLLPSDSDARHGELGYRFQVHGAHYLSPSAAQRHAVAGQLSTIYRTRSRLVHGGKYPGPGEITTAGDCARGLASRGLLRAVHEGFPTREMFRQMVFGTADP
jgi:hypothetical protein